METLSTIGGLLIIGGVLIAPLTIFRCLRSGAGAALVAISYGFGAVLWIICAVSVYAAWGGVVLFIGVMFFGIGPCLMAPVVYLIHADWGNFVAFFV
jgi:hypothetical protein